ncbi:hypothetical protein BJ684DRAFT_8942 [Piptocephalis cylindrospora]|uniref:NodB homology domain-containing protein n=1 Tax=Piptocephalis cylindrospora TaxID=1907219 RepID=A0A4P9Y7I0_9FUNG|nr:hypothetical protein BJ684DRAFT_8942 [Piptocephalis cylindrospora]|eukprot:RKP14211.1 hypothetical protein BJ684DRAFT_8942 [Piptocephalis cylindrospora]
MSNGVDLSAVPVIAPHVAPPGGGSPACPTTPVPASECWWTCGQCRAVGDIFSCPSNTQWGLTYDDGPSTNTSILLDFLKQKNLKATFFVVGSRAITNPKILRRAYEEGHHIAGHTWSHTALTSQTNEQIIAELSHTSRAIREAIGVTPRYIRPPYGDIDNRVRGVMHALGYKAIMWNHDTNDWNLNFGNPTNYDPAWVSGNISQWITSAPSAPDGIVALEHDLELEGVKQAQIAINMALKSNLKVQSVADCQGLTDLYFETSSFTPLDQTGVSNGGGVKSAATTTTTTPSWVMLGTTVLAALSTLLLF